MFKCISVLLLATISSDHQQKQEKEGLLKFSPLSVVMSTM